MKKIFLSLLLTFASSAAFSRTGLFQENVSDDGLTQNRACNKATKKAQLLANRFAEERCRGGVDAARITIQPCSFLGSNNWSLSGLGRRSALVNLTTQCLEGELVNSRSYCSQIRIVKMSFNRNQELQRGSLQISHKLVNTENQKISIVRTPEKWTASSSCPDQLEFDEKLKTLPGGCVVVLDYPNCKCYANVCVTNEDSSSSRTLRSNSLDEDTAE